MFKFIIRECKFVIEMLCSRRTGDLWKGASMWHGNSEASESFQAGKRLIGDVKFKVDEAEVVRWLIKQKSLQP
jgi:hypothetical protein